MPETFTTQDLITELQQHIQIYAPRREGGITIMEWAEAQEISDTAARNQLKKLIARGILEREWAITQDGIRMWVYYKIA